jgi:ligand-binding SRPBCC domain-containing protein
MKIKIATSVNANFQKVFTGFKKNLFLKLAPPFPKVNLLRFDGCKTGDEVHLELDFILFKQRWDALIIDFQANEKEIFFIDKGIKTPFFINEWKHKHLIQKNGENAVIVDDIEFTSPFGFLIYPLIILQFLYRKPIYKKEFKV